MSKSIARCLLMLTAIVICAPVGPVAAQFLGLDFSGMCHAVKHGTKVVFAFSVLCQPGLVSLLTVEVPTGVPAPRVPDVRDNFSIVWEVLQRVVICPRQQRALTIPDKQICHRHATHFGDVDEQVVRCQYRQASRTA